MPLLVAHTSLLENHVMAIVNTVFDIILPRAPISKQSVLFIGCLELYS